MWVEIRGTHFTGATSVTFGGTPAYYFVVGSDSTIRAEVGEASSGDVVVTNANGSDSAAGFTYIFPMGSRTTIHSFNPTSGAAGTTVQIHGSFFTGTTQVSFGGVNARSYTVVSDTLITAVVGNGASGWVLVSSPHGESNYPGFVFLDSTSDTTAVALRM